MMTILVRLIETPITIAVDFLKKCQLKFITRHSRSVHWHAKPLRASYWGHKNCQGYLPDCMKLIFKVLLLGPIVDELLNKVCTKPAWAVSFCILDIFCFSFYPVRIVKDKAWVARICYLVVDHAHPTLESMLVGWEGKINDVYRLDGPSTLP